MVWTHVRTTLIKSFRKDNLVSVAYVHMVTANVRMITFWFKSMVMPIRVTTHGCFAKPVKFAHFWHLTSRQPQSTQSTHSFLKRLALYRANSYRAQIIILSSYYSISSNTLKFKSLVLSLSHIGFASVELRLSSTFVTVITLESLKHHK